MVRTQAVQAKFAVAIRETHTAYVVMVGDVVFKAKKPVRTAFLDFGTPEQRAAAEATRRKRHEAASASSPYERETSIELNR